MSCSASSCNYTYSWSYGDWGSCSATACGVSGKQTRSYSCKRSDGATVANSFCSGSPLISQTCSTPCNDCTVRHPVGWSSFGAYCAEYFQAAGSGLTKTSTLRSGSTKTIFSSYGGRGRITMKCDNGRLRVTNSICSGNVGGITEAEK
jgi:hypothetical protein